MRITLMQRLCLHVRNALWQLGMHFIVMLCSQECSLRSPGNINKLNGIQREMSLDTANKMSGIK